MVTLSVVVPIYNVERYLEECLRSLAGQSLADLEVIMVDDGSPDSSAAIAERFAADDPRFVLVRQPNAGLGAARNRGIDTAAGEYLTFVDSDDVIPPYAFGAMVNRLRESGSDFASGNVHRLNELGTHQSPMHRKIFRTEGRRTHISERETLLIDRLATNKVWRRSFWDTHKLRFPEGVLYEDVSVVIPAHFLAEAVDVLTVPVYLWRERPSDDKSITQDRLHIKGLQDRFRAVREVSDFLRERGLDEGRRNWDATALGSDLRIFMQVLDDAGEEFRAEFLRLGNDYLDTVDPATLPRLKSIERLKWHLVRRSMLPELLEVLTFNKSVEQRKARAVRHGTRYYSEYPFKDDPAAAVPREVYRLDGELVIRQKAERIEWRDGRLVVTGRACLRSLRPNRRIQQYMRAWLVNPETGARVRVPVTAHRANEYLLPPDAATARRDWGGYEISIDPAKLRTSGGYAPGSWFVELWMLNRGIVRRARLGKPQPGAPQRPAAHEVAPGVWVRPGWQGTDGLRLDVDPLRAQLTGHRTDGGELELTGVLGTGSGDATGLRLTRLPGDHWIDIALDPAEPAAKGGAGFSARVALADLADGFAERSAIAGGPAASERWDLRLLHGDRVGARLSLADTAEEGRYHGAHGEAGVERESAGWALVRMGRAHPVITEAGWDGDRLTVAGVFHDSGAGLSLVVRAQGRMEEHVVPLTLDDSRFRVSLRPTALPAFGAEVPLGPGGYRFSVRRTLGPDTFEDRFARVAHALLPELPARTEVGGRAVSVDAVRYDVPVLTVGSALPPAEQGAYAQQRLRERVYPRLREQPVAPGALFESYSGKQYSDSPRGIYEELRRRSPDFPASWIVRERQIALPEGLTEVPHTGRGYFEGLARSEHVVTNAHLPTWFAKRPGQTVVQTWHGSMLKRIGFDIERVQFASRDYHERLAREVAQWDYLVSPSPWATPILRRAFRFEGEILETGYPRNDLFHAPERDALTERVRERLGLPAGKKVVLYAPTWRDDKFYSRGKYKLDLHLDLQAMQRRLGDDHVLLVRRHPNIVDRVPNTGGGFVHDVSTYPEIQELFLVADVLITDYSSLMFDFANTGRPMLFFTYDLADYRDNLRGFYFDFGETAPGPLLETSDQVIDALRDIDAVHAAHADRYEAFTAQFCPLDDGKAAARIADRLFPGIADRSDRSDGPAAAGTPNAPRPTEEDAHR
ncbi:CDP-glycerol:poly(glycerophosphate) glycerophosphotransferase [Murinocardiopsis flavida]|uniref:CDP-glycerol:poly(Glycerophosphate) glycerophosphotransferase n=1 Tax=Murinocardiopsis flavida TaxID=645275 RepID=A0A2P8D6W3_9ACTN|nr:bifunctional glycosyltransferase family 2 protein/CDP-glycerol:glycerophosphate glycerophosphotransferase [Murinocardiopsis flavida]PSK92948.1 CDP-glycerol:poly(glycerophosphate) glycerophosphotransferase [Murinocardiopsis flavida]